jgi:hypothetical protein
MARGWESKSVEEQRNVAQQQTYRLASDVEDRRMAQVRKANLDRQRQALNLQRENILSQRTSNPNRRVALEAALAQVEAQLAALN